MTHDYRALCANLTAALNDWQCETGDDRYEGLLDHARALLAEQVAEWEPMPLPGDAEGLAEVFWAQPVAVGPTDEELREMLNENDWNYISPETFEDIARAVLARWGRPTPQPVAVIERLPEPGEWVWHCYAGVRFWQHGRYNGRQFFIGDGPESQPATHWLPANALPTPEATDD